MISGASVRQVGKVVGALVASGAKRATLYLSAKERVSAQYVGDRDGRVSRHSIIVTIGTPNYQDREFIKRCRRAREPFPVRKVQLKFPRKEAR